MINSERLVKLFMEMVQIDSESFQEAAYKEYLYAHLRSRGLVVKEDGAATVIGGNSGNLIAFLPGRKLTAPVVMLAVHMDTVGPGKGIKPRIEDGVVVSAGDTILGADDKAGAAAVLEVLELLLESDVPHPPLELVFTVGEEQGLLGAKALDRSLLRAEFGYVLDSDGKAGEIVHQAPGGTTIEWKVTGRAAHAGMCPEQGINAIQAAAQAIAGLKLGRIDEETTCNIGVINGGTARNIVPENCWVKGEARSLDKDKLQDLTTRLAADFKSAVEAYGAACEVEIAQLYPNFGLTPGAPVLELAAQAAVDLGITPRLVKSGGGSDANILNGRGIPVANLGVGMQNPHTSKESILISDLEEVTRWLYQIIIRAGASS